jgi:two-component system, LuxR family, response regulator FixJ
MRGSVAVQSSERIVHLVDDDETTRRSTSFLLRVLGYTVEPYSSGKELLDAPGRLTSGTILLDLRMPDMDGLEVQKRLLARGIALPVIVMSASGDLSRAVSAIKEGAVQFVEKPFRKSVILDALAEAEAGRQKRVESRAASDEVRQRLAGLTPRESDILKGIARGQANKVIAYELGISPRTVEIHRAHMMRKLGMRNVAQAIRLAVTAGLGAEAGTSS